MNDKYKKTLSKIYASEQFKNETLQRINNYEKERRYIMNKTKKMVIGFAACVALVFMFIGVGSKTKAPVPQEGNDVAVEMDLTDRIKVDPNAPMACAAVNIEGIIVEVAEEGLSFKLDSGEWVKVTEETEIGITGPNAAPKDEQFFEPTFRIGNFIAGFTIDENSNSVEAYAIYTNWNWENPIR